MEDAPTADWQTIPIVGYDNASAMAPYLSNVRRLNLWGCYSLSSDRLFAILSQTKDLDELGLKISWDQVISWLYEPSYSLSVDIRASATFQLHLMSLD